MSNLAKRIQDQITKQQRQDLGNIKTPGAKVLTFPDVQLAGVDLTRSVQWLKRSYSFQRDNAREINFSSFNNTNQPISRTVISPTTDGSLIDNSLKINDNIEYSIDIFTEISKSYTFRLTTKYPIKLFVYKRILGSDGSYTTTQISTGSNLSVTLNFQSNSWQTILIYLYNDIENNTIYGFENINGVADTWRIPDVLPPPIPEWYTTPLLTETNSLTAVTSNILQWVLPTSKDWAGNGVYYYVSNNLEYSVSSAPYDIALNGFIINSGATAAASNFSIGGNVYPNSPYSYKVSDIHILNPNKITNPMFADTSAANTFKMWTKSPNTSTVKADRNHFYSNGVSITGSSKSAAVQQTAYVEYNTVINLNSGFPHEITIAYKHSSNAKTALVEMKYYRSNGTTPTSTASQFYLLDSSMGWRVITIPIWTHTSPVYLRDTGKTTAHSFKMPSDAVYVKPRFYFYKSTSSASKTNLDFMQICKRSGNQKLLNSTNHPRVVLLTKENIQVPDTRFCKAHVKFNGNINDSVRGITGTQFGTAVYRSSAYFAKFATAIECNQQTRNYIKNGHFSSSISKGTSGWTNSNLYIFATSHTCIFGTRSLKIGATSTSQYVSQTMPATLSGSTQKRFSFYSMRGQSTGVKVLGTLSGVTAFSYTQLYNTSNWQRMLFKCATADTIKIYPNIGTPSSGNHIFIQGLQWENLKYTPYNTNHTNGVQTRKLSHPYYDFTLLDPNRGTIALWYIPQVYSGEYNSHSTHNSQNYSLISNNGNSPDLFKVFWNQASSRFSFITGNSIVANTNTISSTVISYKPNDKIHIAVTWDGNYKELYVNAVPSQSPNKIMYWCDTESFLYIGSGALNCNGYIDDLKIESTRYGQLQIDKDYKANRLAAG